MLKAKNIFFSDINRDNNLQLKISCLKEIILNKLVKNNSLWNFYKRN